jgi:hypothetical protein
MAFSLMLAFGALLGVVVFLVVAALLARALVQAWLLIWGQRPPAPEPNESPVEAVDHEMDELSERVAGLRRTGGSGTWLARLVLWRHCKRLAELRRRRRRLLDAEERWQGRSHGVRLPGAALPSRPAGIQVPPVPRGGIRVGEDEPGTE